MTMIYIQIQQKYTWLYDLYPNTTKIYMTVWFISKYNKNIHDCMIYIQIQQKYTWLYDLYPNTTKIYISQKYNQNTFEIDR